jgi:hypothetical protein
VRAAVDDDLEDGVVALRLRQQGELVGVDHAAEGTPGPVIPALVAPTADTCWWEGHDGDGDEVFGFFRITGHTGGYFGYLAVLGGLSCAEVRTLTPTQEPGPPAVRRRHPTKQEKNTMKGLIITAALAASAFVPAVAQAGIMDQLDAGDQVARVAHHRYHFDAFASCRQIGSRSFTCTIGGTKGDSCFYKGRANVRKVNGYTYKVTTMNVSKDCF